MLKKLVVYNSQNYASTLGSDLKHIGIGLKIMLKFMSTCTWALPLLHMFDHTKF